MVSVGGVAKEVDEGSKVVVVVMAVAVDEEADEENNRRMDRDMKVLVNCVDQKAWALKERKMTSRGLEGPNVLPHYIFLRSGCEIDEQYRNPNDNTEIN